MRDIAINRKTPPSFRQVENINLLRAQQHLLDNAIPLYYINAGELELVRVEFIFQAGTWNEDKALVATATNTLLKEGTSKHTAVQIADLIDYYGAFLKTETTGDYVSVYLFTLNKYLNKVLPIVKEILSDSIFPESELRTYKQNQIQRLTVDNERVDYVARKKFNELLFGDHHPYGHYSSVEDYEQLDRNDLLKFYRDFYTTDNCQIIASGFVNNEVIKLINSNFGDWKTPASKQNEKEKQTISAAALKGKFLIKKDDTIQSAIRIGKLLFNKTHPDYAGMQVLNTVLGGYFGSRLMNNIREDKGFTYGIGSAAASLKHNGYFFITTEVGADVCKQAIDEIYYELNRLRNELIPEEELKLVKNYTLGSFLRSIDGPFALADKFKGILTYNLGYEYYDNFINVVKNISSEELKVLANKYFQEDSFLELVVGKKD
jgi:zinc protease